MSIQGAGNEAVYQTKQAWQEKAEQAGQMDRKSAQASAKESNLTQDPDLSQEPKTAVRPRYDRYEPERKTEICTMDTGKVDREIERLREEKVHLSEQVRMTDDPQKKEALKRQLAQVERELAQKDNDTYRRQNAVVTGA